MANYSTKEVQVLTQLAANHCVMGFVEIKKRLSDQEIQELINKQAIKVSNQRPDTQFLAISEQVAIQSKFKTNDVVVVLNAYIFDEIYHLYWLERWDAKKPKYGL